MAQRAIEPLYVTLTNGFTTRSGKIRFLVCGSDGDNEDPDEDEAEEDEEDEGSEGSSGKKKESDDDKPDSEAETLRKRLKAADKNNSKLQQRLKELEDKDKDEKTRATERVTELESEVTEKDGLIASLTLQVAFLLSNDQAWEDPEYALDFAQRKGYLEDVVDEDGEIDRDELKKALKKLAEDKPSMIKRAAKDDEEEEDDSPPATDQGVGNRRKNGKGRQFDEKVLAGRYPAAFR